MKIEKVKLDEIILPAYNPRDITPEDLEKLQRSIDEFGYVEPIIVNDVTNHVVGGNQRAKALKELGYTEVDAVIIHNEDLNREKALNIALNKISGEWDYSKLAEILDDMELEGFDITLTGFDGLDELDIDLDDDFNNDYEIEEDEYDVPDEYEITVTVQEGDIYQLGQHRLMCGDSTNKETVQTLMNGNLADLFLTDPPYNVDYTDGHENERKILNDNFDSDEEAGEKLWRPAFNNAREVANEYCSIYCFMPQGGTHMMMMMMMMMRASWQVKHELIWVKQSVVLGRQDYNYQHEPILYGWGDKHKFYGKGQYSTTSVWNFDRPTKSKEHPTMKPIELLGEILLNATVENDKVLDLFGGSGSTMIACEQLNRQCFMMELDPYYCQVIINRWEEYTGEKAERINPEDT